MTFIVIDGDGTLQLVPRGLSYDGLAKYLGPHGTARVRLHAVPDMCGVVSDCGLVIPDVYARNQVGTCVLACFGAGLQPYAGPVVFVGWQDRPGDMIGLSPRNSSAVVDIHRSVSAVLAGMASGYGVWWDREIQATAALAVSGETPGIEVVDYDEYVRRTRNP